MLIKHLHIKLAKNYSGKHIGSRQRQMAYNLYLEQKQSNSKSASITLTAKLLGRGERTVWNIVKQMDTACALFAFLETYTSDNLRSFGRRWKVNHPKTCTFLNNELATCTKIFSVNILKIMLTWSNELICRLMQMIVCNLKRTTLWKVLKKLRFKWVERSRENVLMERQGIVLWRHRVVIWIIIGSFVQKEKIHYLDETWVNAVHTKQIIWKATTIVTPRQALLEGVTAGLW